MTYSRSMIAKVTLPSSVGFIGTEHNVMVMHMHNELANNVHGPEKLDEFGGGASGKDHEIRGEGPDGRLQYVPLQGHTRTPQSRSSD